MLAGNVVAIALSAIVCIGVSMIKPQNFDWALMKEIPMVEHDEAAYSAEGAVRGCVACVLFCRVTSAAWAHQDRAQAAIPDTPTVCCSYRTPPPA
jgi:hypothetical protein